jgi:hypothetical protein
MTSHDRWTDMADLDAELERLLSGGAPSAEAPAWFGDVAVLVRAARAPARPDELAGEADIVARMVEVRLAVLAEAEAEVPVAGTGDGDGDEGDAGAAPAVTAVNGVNGHAHRNGTDLGRDEAVRNGTDLGRDEAVRNGTDLGRDEAVRNGTDLGGDEAVRNGTDLGRDEAVRNGTDLGAYAAADVESEGGQLEERLRERIAVSDLDEYRAKHGGERYYVAKHAARPPEEPPHPVARTVGRVIAMKAVAVTTAAVIGVAAAAAATTGIVANVVVPAISEHYRRPVPTSESPVQQQDEDEPTTDQNTRNPSVSIVTCETVLAPCVPPPLVSVTDPATGVPLVATTTTVPTPASTSTSVPATTTTSTTDSPTTSTSEPDPPPPTSTPTTVAGDPAPFSP